MNMSYRYLCTFLILISVSSAFSAGLLDTVGMMNQICDGGNCSTGGIQSYSSSSAQHDSLRITNMVGMDNSNNLFIRNSEVGEITAGVPSSSQALTTIYMSLNYYNPLAGGDRSCSLTRDPMSGLSLGFLCTQIEHSPGCPDPENPTCRMRMIGADPVYRAFVGGEGAVNYNDATVCSPISTSSAAEKKNCSLSFVMPEFRIDDW
jgi:hypothetical protein